MCITSSLMILLRSLRESRIHDWVNPKRAPLQHFLLYLHWSTFFRTGTLSLFSFKPCAHFKTIFVKIGPRVMTPRHVIASWVNEKLDFPLKLHIKSCFCLFCVLPLCFVSLIWFICSKNVCKHSLTHIIAK